MDMEWKDFLSSHLSRLPVNQVRNGAGMGTTEVEVILRMILLPRRPYIYEFLVTLLNCDFILEF